MRETAGSRVSRVAVDVGGKAASYLTVAQDGPVVWLLHGTSWSRVWFPVLDRMADAGFRPITVDLPGMGAPEESWTSRRPPSPPRTGLRTRSSTSSHSRAST